MSTTDKTEKQREKLSRVRAAAGRKGGIARWKDVEREPTVKIRVYAADAAWLKAQPGTIAEALKRLRGR